MTMQKIQTMAAPMIGDTYAALDGQIWADFRGLAVSDPVPGFGAVRVTRVGAYWSAEGASGWWVECDAV